MPKGKGYGKSSGGMSPSMGVRKTSLQTGKQSTNAYGEVNTSDRVTQTQMPSQKSGYKK